MSKGLEVLYCDNELIKRHLAEALVFSAFPMSTEMDTFESLSKNIDNVYYWLNNNIIEVMNILERNKNVKEFNRRTPNTIRLEEDYAVIECRDNEGKLKAEALIDFEDIYTVSQYKWHLSNNGYVQAMKSNGTSYSLHRVVMNYDGELFIDHINGNPLDNRRANLRLVSNQQNIMNCGLSKNNSSGATGVSFRKDRNKWRAYIMLNRKQISLGMYDTFEEAYQARIDGEIAIFGEYARGSLDIRHEKNYDLHYAIRTLKRGRVLGSAKHGSGHDCHQKGVIVNAVISAPSYWYPQMQRYHFLDIISSQSKMHRITKMDLETQCIDEVDQRAIDLLNEMIDIYNNVSEEHKEDAFRKVLANCPMGLKLTCAITTNYLQLKGIRNQRKGHKLSEWRVDFMEWLDSLPYFKELTGEDNEL